VIPAPFNQIKLFGERRREPEKKTKTDGGDNPSKEGKSKTTKVEVKGMPPKDDEKFVADAAWKRSVDDGLKFLGEVKPRLEQLKDGPSEADWEQYKANTKDELLEHVKSVNRETRRLEFQSFADKDPYVNTPALQHPLLYLKRKPVEKFAALLGITTKDPAAKNVQEAADDLLITHMLMKRHGENYQGMKSLAMFDRYMEVSEDFRKAMDTATATEGLEWIPTELSADLIDQISLELRVAALFRRFWMPTPVFKFPVKTGGFTVYYLSEATADVDEKIPTSDIPTADVTFTARKLGGRLLVSSELTEDSIVAVLPLIKKEIVDGLADGQEDCIINGDRSSTHQDSDVTNAKDRRKAFAGLRKLCPAASFRDVTTYDIADLRAVRALMGKYGVDPSKLCHVMSIGAYMTTLSFSEVATVDKFGEKATWLKGYLSAIDGIPIEISEKVREDLNASGVYDGVTTTKTLTILVRKDAYLIGDRRMPTVKSAANIETDQEVTVVTQRMDFEKKFAAAEKDVAINYNV
jgi:HK97 family phage major capsid protein